MLAWDSHIYLADDLIVLVDRAALSLGLETCAPFPNHRVDQVACGLPMSINIRGNTSKWALRQILYLHVPWELIESAKAGCAFPIASTRRAIFAPSRSPASASNLQRPLRPHHQAPDRADVTRVAGAVELNL